MEAPNDNPNDNPKNTYHLSINLEKDIHTYRP